MKHGMDACPMYPTLTPLALEYASAGEVIVNANLIDMTTPESFLGSQLQTKI